MLSINVSAEFKTQVKKVVFFITLFVLAYLVLAVIATAFALAIAYFGLMIMANGSHFLTFVAGIGLIATALIIVGFLFKFMVKGNSIDESNFIRLTADKEPRLFALITEIAETVGTSLPKKVFLGGELNASVYYNSNFWSLFFPVRKNLLIGAALIECLTEEELKAILAHEFGHFSQKSMKASSFVYHVNKSIYYMLEDRATYTNMVNQLGNYLSLFVLLAVLVIGGIQWVLSKIYYWVQINYMGLSRQMEFHADEIAANISNGKALTNALLRLPLAECAFSYTLNFFNSGFDEGRCTNNIFEQYRFVMHKMAQTSRLPYQNGLPLVTLDYMKRFNKSKLIVENQWASHPSTEDRIERLKQINFNDVAINGKKAIEIFDNYNQYCEDISYATFINFLGDKEPEFIEHEDFVKQYIEKNELHVFDEMFNGFYDEKHPALFDFEVADNLPDEKRELEELVGFSAQNEMFINFSLADDIQALYQIAHHLSDVKTFDYDGKKYEKREAKALREKLEKEYEKHFETIKLNDMAIYKYFSQLAKKQGKFEEYKLLYKSFFDLLNDFDKKRAHLHGVIDASQFFQNPVSIDHIRGGLRNLDVYEKPFKQIIRDLKGSIYEDHISDETKVAFEKYTAKVQNYFLHDNFDDNAIQLFFQCVHEFDALLAKVFGIKKKELLEYKTQLERNKV